jgi:hypothetical protein
MPRQSKSVQKPSRSDIPALERLTIRIPQAVEVSGISRTKIYELIRTGALQSRKVAGCRVIPVAGLRRLMGV